MLVHNETSPIEDGTGGVIIAWEDWGISNESAGILIQKLNASGMPQWKQYGKRITLPEFGHKEQPQITGDGKGGAIITYLDYDGESVDNSVEDIYAQHVDAYWNIWPGPVGGSLFP